MDWLVELGVRRSGIRAFVVCESGREENTLTEGELWRRSLMFINCLARFVLVNFDSV